MYIDKEKINIIKNSIEGDFEVFIDSKLFLKDICNPYHTSDLKYENSINIYKYFKELHKYLEIYFGTDVSFLLSLDKIHIANIPGYKEDFYSKYFDDEDRDEFLDPIRDAFIDLINESIVNGDSNFVNTTNSYDEFNHVRNKSNPEKTAVVVTRDKIFNGYSDIIQVNPLELGNREYVEKDVPLYNKIVISMIGDIDYSLPKVKGMGVKKVNSIISKLLDKSTYIHYNNSRNKQALFPITYEDLNEVVNISREDYDLVLANWDYLNH